MSEFALQVVDIDETGKDYTFELKQPWVAASLADANLHIDPEAGPGTLEVHAQKNGNEYLVTGQVRAKLTTDCGRCLGVAHVPVETSFATLFTRSANTAHPAGHAGPGHKGHAKEADEDLELDESDDEELSREEFSGHEIVLDTLIREYLVLETPMQPLCSEDCTGIAVPKHVQPPEDVFGSSDSKVDPRLAPLLRLRDKVPPK